MTRMGGSVPETAVTGRQTKSTAVYWTASTSHLLRGPVYKISYDLSYDYRKFIVRSTYDSDLERAEIFLRNIVS